MSPKCFAAVLLCTLPVAVLAVPGKSTVAASDPLQSLAFLLRYLPVTVAEDEGAGNEMSGGPGTTGDAQGKATIQGRVQVLQHTSYTARNCQLFSQLGSLGTASKYDSMTSNGVGKACSYNKGKKYEAGTKLHLLHEVFAFNEKQCCNACVATENCAGATFLTSSEDHSGGFGPQDWEGFGIHTVNVQSAKTTGGFPVQQVEEHYRSRFGKFEEFDQFMDYSITFFTTDLQSYFDAFTKDNVPFLLAQWATEEKEQWFSLIFLVNTSHHVIEIVGNKKPTGSSGALPMLEQRMSSQHCAKFTTYPSDSAPYLYIASINRAASNLTAIDDVYSKLLLATTTHQIDDSEVTRRCYNLSDHGESSIQAGSSQSSGPPDRKSVV